jgi:hypothetical protein
MDQLGHSTILELLMEILWFVGVVIAMDITQKELMLSGKIFNFWRKNVKANDVSVSRQFDE